jgi:phthiocerol/phenolphthiocerol synthesis type-I polyketide synthase E
VAVAHRGARRWALTLAPVQLGGDVGTEPFRKHGVYLITGGLGALGLAVAAALFENHRTRLVLVGRTTLPSRERWDEIAAGEDGPEADRIRAVRALEQRGAELMVLEADVADLAQMKSVCAQAAARFGAINGVVHAAGVVETTPIHGKSRHDVEAILRPKVMGAMVLEEVFADQPLDVVVLFSSVASLEGGASMMAYTAANAFLDAHALRPARSSRRTVAVNWDAWKEVGMAVEAKRALNFAEAHDVFAQGLDTGEAVRAFFAAAASGRPQVIVTRRDLTRALEQRKLARAATRAAPDKTAAGEPSAANDTAPRSVLSNRRMHPRPALREDYVAPATAAEKAMAEIWQEFLRVEPIGVKDDFFELGGHSILALQMLPRVRARFQVELQPRDIWAAPTVGAIVLLVEERVIAELERNRSVDRQERTEPDLQTPELSDRG